MLEANSPQQTAQRVSAAPYVTIRRILSLIALLILLSVVSSVTAQVTNNATLRGVVKDQKGALIPDATLTLTNTERGEQRQAKSSDDGSYVFTAVPPGTYTLKAEVTGFKAYERANFRLAPSETQALDLTLEVGSPTETITVSAEDISPLRLRPASGPTPLRPNSLTTFR